MQNSEDSISSSSDQGGDMPAGAGLMQGTEGENMINDLNRRILSNEMLEKVER